MKKNTFISKKSICEFAAVLFGGHSFIQRQCKRREKNTQREGERKEFEVKWKEKEKTEH